MHQHFCIHNVAETLRCGRCRASGFTVHHYNQATYVLLDV